MQKKRSINQNQNLTKAIKWNEKIFRWEKQKQKQKQKQNTKTHIKKGNKKEPSILIRVIRNNKSPLKERRERERERERVLIVFCGKNMD